MLDLPGMQGVHRMEHWQIYAVGIGTATAVITVVAKMSNDYKKSISRVYDRFDEYKQHLESTHVSKELFSIIHKQLVVDISEIKADVKQLLKNGTK